MPEMRRRLRRLADGEPGAGSLNMHSQHDEERYIVDFFQGRTGSFLDVGAWDGVEASNTRALALAGWRGLLVEPCPAAFSKLLKNTEHIPGLVCMNAAVSRYSELRKFHLQSEWGGTLNEEILKENLRKTVASYYVRTASAIDLLEIAEREKMRLEFVSIDAEWMDGEILMGFRGLLTRTDLLCIEVWQDKFAETDPIPALCSELGFNRTIARTPCNLLVAR